MERKRISPQLDSPFSPTQWPGISQTDQDVIFELLCGLLSPLGDYRRAFIHPSKGKRSKRARSKPARPNAGIVPPPPELAAYVDVGLSSISRCLESTSASHSSTQQTTQEETARADQSEPALENAMPYSVVFVARSGQTSAFSSHFPSMVAAASRGAPLEHNIRLVGFSKPCADRLSACLGIPRVSSIGLRVDAPRAEALVDFARRLVPPVDASWLRRARSMEYLGTKINMVEAKVGAKKQRVS